ncbi:MAG: MarR family winged helix-turn-helix transcriptional regulator, partial [Trebonia sp.]
AVGRFHAALRSRLSLALRDHDLTVPEFTALSVLSLRSGLSNAQLARRSFVTPQAMNQVLASLEGKGLVTRQISPGTGPHAHHRARGATLTARGEALVRRTDALVDEIEDRAFGSITPEQRLELSALLLDATVRLRTARAGDD